MSSEPTPFAELPPTARSHLMLRFYEAVLALLCYGEDRARAAGEPRSAILDAHGFLGVYTAQLARHVPAGRAASDALREFRRELRRWEDDVDTRLPLRALGMDLGLDDARLLALLLVGMLEEDPRFGEVFAAAQGGPGRRPTVGLLHRIVAAAGCPTPSDAWALSQPLVDAGLAEVLNPADPRADWQLRVPVQLWSGMGAEPADQPLPGVRWHPPASWEPLDALILDDTPRRHLVEARALLASGDASALVVRGLPGSERIEAVGAVARSLGRGLLAATATTATATTLADAWRLIGPLATLAGAVPAFVLELGPGEVFTIPTLTGYRGPVGVVLGYDGGIGGPATERALAISLPPEDIALRERHWARAFPDADPATHQRWAGAYTLGGRYVRRAGALARAHAAMERRTTVTADDVRLAARSINRQELDSLAARLEDGGGWERLVLHPTTASELRRLEQRCRHRERLTTALARDLPGGLNRGVRALLQGPSGTGKTLAARVLASELGLDLYRVDLSSVISKYVGETEKNLSRVFGRAEDLDVMLLLDEGDSLMGKRTQVRSSNDRWANLETNYLLQRLDTYTGIVVVTTNSPGSIDSAFQRRMDVVVRFHRPSFEERWHLWQQHLPPDHAVEPDVVEAAALRYELTGGQIRNAVVDAALTGLDSPDQRLRAHDLASAVEAEYRKAGASSPRERSRPDNGRADAMSAFLGAIE